MHSKTFVNALSNAASLRGGAIALCAFAFVSQSVLAAPGNTAVPGTTKTELDAGRQALSQRDFKNAENHFNQALSSAKSAHSDLGTSYALCGLGMTIRLREEKARYAQAEEWLKQALSLRQSILGNDSGDVANAAYELGAMYKQDGRNSEAISAFNRSIGIRNKLKLDAQNEKVLAVNLNELAGIYERQNNWRTAEPLLARAYKINKDPDTGRDLVRAYLVNKQGPQACAIFHGVPQAANKLNGIDAAAFVSCGFAEKSKKNALTAANCFETAIAILDAQKANSKQLVEALDALAFNYKDASDLGKAESIFRRALSERQKNHQNNDPYVQKGVNNLYWLLVAEQKKAEADKLKSDFTVKSPENPGIHLVQLGFAERRKNNFVEAAKYFEQAVALTEKQPSARPLDLAQNLDFAAFAYQDAKQYAKSEALFKHALSVRLTVLAKDDPAIEKSVNNLYWIYVKEYKKKEADALKSQYTFVPRKANAEKTVKKVSKPAKSAKPTKPGKPSTK